MCNEHKQSQDLEDKVQRNQPCKYCREFFSHYSCGMSVYLECDCPKCQGYCECGEEDA